MQGMPISNGAILHTVDGGKTWHNCTPAGVSSQDVYAGGLAVSDSEAWLATATVWNVPSTTKQKITLYHTTNGGFSWTSTTIPKGYDIADFSFIDAQQGWLLASPGPATAQEPIDLYSTSDGGKTWSQILSKTEANSLIGGQKTGITFVNSTTGWLPVDSGQHTGQVEVYMTHDGGHSWDLQNIAVPASLQTHYAHPLGPRFTSSQVGIMPVTFDNSDTIIYTTRDGGQTWNPTTPIPVSSVVSVSTDGETIYLTDGKTVYYSRTDGQRWEKWKGTINFGDYIGGVTLSDAYVVIKDGSTVEHFSLNTLDFVK